MALRVAVIGISNKGSNSLPILPSAPGDALRLLNILRQYQESETNFFTALEPEHTLAHILREGLVRFFSETKPADNAMFVFEGHGLEIDGKVASIGNSLPWRWNERDANSRRGYSLDGFRQTNESHSAP